MNKEFICGVHLTAEELVLLHSLVSEPLKTRKMRRRLGEHIDLFHSLKKKLDSRIKDYEIYLKEHKELIT